MLPCTQKDMRPLKPPKDFWDLDMLEQARGQWHEVRGFVDHGRDVGTQAFAWDDCSVAAVRIDRAVTYWSYVVDSMLCLLQDLRMVDYLGWCRKGPKRENIDVIRAMTPPRGARRAGERENIDVIRAMTKNGSAEER